MPAEVAVHRLTSAQVLQMVETGGLDEDARIELLDGVLCDMSPQGPSHASITVALRVALNASFGAGFHVRDHSPIDAGPHSMPEPDLAVVRGTPRDYLTRYPAGPDIALVVEVSVTAQAYDRAKVGIYARAGVPEVWQLDVPARTLRVHTEPDTEAGEYGSIRVLRDDANARAGLAGSGVPIRSVLP
ncbi:MAG: Uma2 family endonuclease [Myxococcales bacterium]|nr:Uma2 family endonuclease [Myxococcales bacterium]